MPPRRRWHAGVKWQLANMVKGFASGLREIKSIRLSITLWDTHTCWLSAGKVKGLSNVKHPRQAGLPSTAQVPATGQFSSTAHFSMPLFCLFVVSLGAHLEIIEKDKMTLICYQLEEMWKLFSNLWLWSIRLKTPREVIGIITPAPEYFYYALEIRVALCFLNPMLGGWSSLQTLKLWWRVTILSGLCSGP